MRRAEELASDFFISRMRLGWLTLLYVGVMGGVISIIFRPDSSGIALAIVCFMTVLLIGLYLYPIERPDQGPTIASPLFLVGCVVYLALCLRSLAVIFLDLSTDLQDPSNFSYLGTGFGSHYLLGLSVGFGLWLSLILGYWSSSKTRDHPAERRQRDTFWHLPASNENNLVLAIGIIAGLGWIARLISVATSRGTEEASSIATLTLSLSIMAPLALVFALVYANTLTGVQSNLSRLAGLLIVGEIGFSLATGSRQALLGVVIIGIGLVGLRRPIRLKMHYLFLVLLFVPILGVTVQYGNGLENDASISVQAQQAIERSSDLGLGGLLEAGITNLIARYHGVDSLASIMTLPPVWSPTFGFHYLEQLVLPVVPRIIWPDKPFMTDGQVFAQYYWKLSPENPVSMAPTWFGDIILQFTIWLAPAMCFFLGYLLQRLYRMGLRGYRNRSLGVVLYLVFLPTVVSADSWIGLGLYQFTQTAIVGTLSFVLLKFILINTSPAQYLNQRQLASARVTSRRSTRPYV